MTRIVMGHSKQSRWQQLWQGSIVDSVLRKLNQMDLFLMADRAEHEGERIMPIKQRSDSEKELFRRFSLEERESKSNRFEEEHSTFISALLLE